MEGSSLRVTRKVKIDGKWIFAAVQLDRAGRPDPKHVMHKGSAVTVTGGTFYIDHGYGANRKRVACGSDPDAVKRAIKTQIHVLELRSRGMDVGDAQEIVDSRRETGDSIRSLFLKFTANPPTGYTRKTIDKYKNALRVFADWAAPRGVLLNSHVTEKVIKQWISHMQTVEQLDASTLVPKVRIVLGELKRKGHVIELEKRTLPQTIEREREIYTAEELTALFNACTQNEFELFQVFLMTGMRFREVAYLTWKDIDPAAATMRVVKKRELGFMPKAYHERTIPVPRSLLAMLHERSKRMGFDVSGLIFPTERSSAPHRKAGGKADTKMLEKLKQIARREGLNCGHCTAVFRGKKVTCKTHSVCKKWGLHKFRHTYATSMLRDKVDIVTLSKWMGHKDLATTRIYLRALDAETSQPQVEQSTLATQFASRKSFDVNMQHGGKA